MSLVKFLRVKITLCYLNWKYLRKNELYVIIVSTNYTGVIKWKKAKPSSPLKVGDVITIFFAKKEVVYEVLELKDSTKKEDATKMFKIVSEKTREEDNGRA